jgi:hypothetical protein
MALPTHIDFARELRPFVKKFRNCWRKEYRAVNP